MIEAWSTADVRAAEAPLLEAGVPLMERAAFALAMQVLADLRARRRHARGARVALLVGAGNNGGDALHAGAVLARRGVGVTAVLVSERTHAGGLVALRSAGGHVVELFADPSRTAAVAAGAVSGDVVLDGLVGIGARGALRGAAADLVTAVTDALGGAPAPWIVAVDLPSGIGADDGTVDGPVLPAGRTVTFGAAKPGLLLPPAARTVGELTVVDIGLTFEGTQSAPALRQLDARDVGGAWPVPGPADHKYTRGVVGLVAGTPTYPGAAVLAASAAVRAGAGMVRYRGPEAVGHAVLAVRPEVVVAHGRVQSWVVGPGLPTDDEGQRDRSRGGLAEARGDTGAHGAVPAVVDAGGLDLLEPPCPPWFVLTPHAGELATLLQRYGERADRRDVEAAPLRWARRAHELTGATVLLKGGVTVVVGPGGAFAQADAPAWLSTAGAGDVLAGLLGAMLAARSADVVERPALAADIAAAAALVHGHAARRANPGGPVAALDVAEALPATVAELVAQA